MRFMMLMIPKGYESAPAGAVPDAAAVEAMMKYNTELQDAGVLLALDGLHPPAVGARVRVSRCASSAGRARTTPPVGDCLRRDREGFAGMRALIRRRRL